MCPWQGLSRWGITITCLMQMPLQYDWNIVKGTLKPRKQFWCINILVLFRMKLDRNCPIYKNTCTLIREEHNFEYSKFPKGFYGPFFWQQSYSTLLLGVNCLAVSAIRREEVCQLLEGTAQCHIIKCTYINLTWPETMITLCHLLKLPWQKIKVSVLKCPRANPDCRTNNKVS